VIRVYKLGVLVKERINDQSKAPSRVQMAQFFGRQFEKNVRDHVAVLQSKWVPRYDQQNLLEKTTSYIYSINSIFELVDQLKGKVKRNQRLTINSAEEQLTKFHSYVNLLNIYDLNDTTGYVDALKEVINEARFFFFQFNLVCDCFINDHKPKFRPTNIVKKLAFLKIVIAYEDIHGKFPPYIYMSRELKHLSVSQRTWGMWKTQIEDGTFPHFVQHKKSAISPKNIDS
jgi:hypothetical protein